MRIAGGEAYHNPSWASSSTVLVNNDRLVTYLLLAFAILPMVIITTVMPALCARFDRHRKLGRF